MVFPTIKGLDAQLTRQINPKCLAEAIAKVIDMLA